MIKNTAGQKIGAQLITASDGSAFTGSVTVAVTVDAGTQATGSVGSGACAHEGGGYHTYAPAQAETNGDLIAFTFSGTGAVPVTVQVYTIPGVLPTAAALQIIDDNVDAILVDTADMQPKLGTPAVSVSADIADVESKVDDLEGRLTTARAGYLDNLSAGAVALESTAQSILTDTAEIGAAGAGLTEAGGTGDHLTAINLPDQTMNITGNITGNLSGSVGSVTGAVGSVTGNVGGNVTGSVGSLATQAKADVNAEVVDALTVDVVADSVPADGSRPTIAQALYIITQFLTERAVSGTTVTVKKPDGTTSLMTLTLDDDTAPTSITRAT